jgi:hypothetical protein
MQIKVTDKDFYFSARNLTRQDLQAQIYEAIHVLACNLSIEDKLANPIVDKRAKSIKNHPVSKLWKGYEFDLLTYIYYHITEWYNRGYKSEINEKNYWILQDKIGLHPLLEQLHLRWITDEFIQIHRSNLIRKEIERNVKTIKKYPEYEGITNIVEFDKMKSRMQTHYRNLWPDCPADIPMRYDWRQ